MPLYLPRDILRKNDQAAAEADTASLVDDVTQQYKQAIAPPLPQFQVPSLASLGVSDQPSPVMSAIGAIPQRAAQATRDTLSWALPSLDSLGVSPEKPAEVQEPETEAASTPARAPSGAATAVPGAMLEAGPSLGEQAQQATGTASRQIERLTNPAPSSANAGPIDNSSRAAFVKTAYPYMLEAAGGNRDAAEMMLAAAISENGSVGSGRPFWANNFFGIKGRGDAGSANAATWEAGANGERQNINDDFAAYSTPVAGFRAFFDFLQNNSRYAPALANYQKTGDAQQLFRDVNAAGYATDKSWADKVANIRANQVAPVVASVASTQSMNQTQPSPGLANDQKPAPQRTYAPTQDVLPTRPTEASWIEQQPPADGATMEQPLRPSYPSQVGPAVGGDQMSYRMPLQGGQPRTSQSASVDGVNTGAVRPATITPPSTPAAPAQTPATSTQEILTIDNGLGQGAAGRMQVTRQQWEQMDQRFWQIVERGQGALPVASAGTAGQTAAPASSTQPATSTSQQPMAATASTSPQSSGDLMLRQPVPPASMASTAYASTATPGDAFPTDASPPGASTQPPPWEQQTPPPAVPGAGAFQDDATQNGQVSPWTSSSGSLPTGSDAAVTSNGSANGMPLSVLSNQQIPNEDQTSYPLPDYRTPASPLVEAPPTDPAAPPPPYAAGQAASMEPQATRFSGPTETQRAISSIPARSTGLLGEGTRPQSERDAANAFGLEASGQTAPPINLGGIPVSDLAMGGMVEQLDRMHQIQERAAAYYAAEGKTDKTNGMVAVRDPKWRAAYPDLAQEYDDLQVQVALNVGGQVGDVHAAGVSGPSIVERAQPIAQRAADVLDQGVQRGREIVSDIGTNLRENAGRVAALDAERAGQRGAVSAPGVFGVAPPEAGQAAQDVLRPRIVPPDVAVGLGVERRVPDDPRLEQAVRAAGGQITDRGVELNLTRAQDPGAAGGVATRGGVFYEARPRGEVSSYYTPSEAGPQGTGGNQGIPAEPTVIRSPLVLPDEVGTESGFNTAMQQLGRVDSPEIQAAQQRVNETLNAYLAARRDNPRPNIVLTRYQDAYEEAKAALDALRPSYSVVNKAIDEARRAGPPGSPERGQAIKDLIARYGGDPSVIDDLLTLRGADASESAYAIRENIVAQNARAAGHDAVMALTRDEGASTAELAAHPKVQAAQQELQAAIKAKNEAYSRVMMSGAPADKAALDQANAAFEQAQKAWQTAKREAFEELSNRVKIREVMDVREARNPTPGSPNPRIAELEQAIQDLHDRGVTASSAFDPLYEELDAVRGAETSGRPGYALRPEYAPRAEAQGLPASTIAENPVRMRAEEAYARLSDQVEAMRQAMGPYPTTRQLNALMDLEEALKDARLQWYDAQTAPRYVTDPEATRRAQRGGTTASGVAGVLPGGASPDRLATVNRALSQGVASAVSGGVTAAANQQLNPDDPNAGLKGFAVGAVAPLAISHGARVLSRAAGAEGRRAEGALATLGSVPPGLPPQVQRAVRQAQAAQKPGLSPLEWTRRLAGEVGYSSMIGPATFSVNVLGNMMEPMWAIPKEATRAIVRGNPREFIEMAGGAFHGMGQVGTAMVDALASRGRFAATPGHEPLSQLTNNPIGKAITTGLEAGGRVFSALPDAVFGTIAQGAGEARTAAQRATDMGLKGQAWKQHVSQLLADVEQVKTGQLPSMTGTQDVIDGGIAYAKRQTFQDELGTVGRKARAMSGANLPVVGNLITPFFNTPWNMNTRMLERTPVGFAMNSQGGRFDRMYDATVGSALLIGLAAGPVASGQITGGGPNDPQKKAEMRSQGWRPYSTLVDGVYVPNRVFGIYAPLMNAAADAHDSIVYAKDKSPASITSDFAGRIGQQIQQQPYLIGLSNIMQTLQAGQGGGLTGAADRFASSTITRMVPYGATARTVGTALDPNERTVDQGKNVPAATTISQQVQGGIGLRGDLPVAQDVLGRSQANPQQGWGALFAKTSPEKVDPTIKAFQDSGVDIGFPKTTLTIDTIPVDLTPAETRRWQTLRGEVLQRFAANMTSKPWWNNPTARQAGMNELLQQANQAADQRLMQSIGAPEIRRRVREAQQEKRQQRAS